MVTSNAALLEKVETTEEPKVDFPILGVVYQAILELVDFEALASVDKGVTSALVAAKTALETFKEKLEASKILQDSGARWRDIWRNYYANQPGAVAAKKSQKGNSSAKKPIPPGTYKFKAGVIAGLPEPGKEKNKTYKAPTTGKRPKWVVVALEQGKIENFKV